MEYEAGLENYLKAVRTRLAKYWESFPNLPLPKIEVHPGRRYDKIVQTGSQTHVHSFVDKTNGNILKAATWRAPAKHARGNIYDKIDEAFGGESHNVRYL